MNWYLLALSIGPVQEFIAAARRTRDLWFGSFMLSELSKAAAKAIADRVGIDCLIFPAAEDATDLEATPHGEEPRFTVANIILAQVPDNPLPESLLQEAKHAVAKRWRSFAEEARAAAGDIVRDELWRGQVDDVVEVYAAWLPFEPESEHAYKNARKRLMRLLEGRKRCRDFAQPEPEANRRARLPKSSLDGRRETVLIDLREGHASDDLRRFAFRKLRLQEGEQLDVVGLTKRLAHGARPYPSVARIAADPWLRRIARCAEQDTRVAEAFDALKQACEKLGTDIIRCIDPSRFPAYRDFPFEGTAVYRTRYASLADESQVNRERLERLARAVRKLSDPPDCGGLGFGAPSPYVAILVADGDHMGRLIAEMSTAEEHRAFSQRLAQFAARVRQIVADHNGACIYAGGDDVLALLPVDKCLRCARKLRDDFQVSLQQFGNPTFSVGVAIGHFLEPLEDLRAYGRAAEQRAKGPTPGVAERGIHAQRNGLAVFVHPRSGVAFGIREQWQAGQESIDERLQHWAELFSSHALPHKFPYDLRRLADQYHGWRHGGALVKALQADVQLLLSRKETKLTDADRQWLNDRCATVEEAAGARRLADEMLVASHIGQVLGQARRTPETTPRLVPVQEASG
ncbi:MAG: type III-B CRISPR-associated protein Cas10/Cmr2 [Planctomycetes bacterium]|nr:type III-B CRISPR-associated protein Cas10/Cmr2 [Planctomycetota bacterium]